MQWRLLSGCDGGTAGQVKQHRRDKYTREDAWHYYGTAGRARACENEVVRERVACEKAAAPCGSQLSTSSSPVLQPFTPRPLSRYAYAETAQSARGTQQPDSSDTEVREVQLEYIIA